MSNLIPVKGEENKGYVRDVKSNAIIYNDQDEYDKYMCAYNARKLKEKELTSLREDINKLKCDIQIIKDSLLLLANK